MIAPDVARRGDEVGLDKVFAFLSGCSFMLVVYGVSEHDPQWRLAAFCVIITGWGALNAPGG